MKLATRTLLAMYLTIASLSVNSLFASSFIEDHKSLKPFIFRESDTNIKFGAGVIPFQIVKDKLGVAFSLFQIHYTNRFVDWEIFNGSFGLTFGSSPQSKIQNFTFRTSPKYRINSLFSVGGVLGYEFVRFPDIDAKIANNQFETPYSAFTGDSLVWGAELCETVPFGDRFLLKASQLFYKQNYSTSQTPEAWDYTYRDTTLNVSTDPIDPGWVFLLQFSLVY